MVDGIRCPMCGSDEIAEVLYGMPAYDEGLMARIDAGDAVLNGCGISADDPMHPYDLMRALELYQLAERGLRIDIARGQTYYAERLQEALDGQDHMREVLGDPLFRPDAIGLTIKND